MIYKCLNRVLCNSKYCPLIFFKQSKRVKHLKSLVIYSSLGLYNVQGNVIAHLEMKKEQIYVTYRLAVRTVQAGNKPFFQNYFKADVTIGYGALRDSWMLDIKNLCPTS